MLKGFLNKTISDDFTMIITRELVLNIRRSILGVTSTTTCTLAMLINNFPSLFSNTSYIIQTK